jgi:hypothetical protein
MMAIGFQVVTNVQWFRVEKSENVSAIMDAIPNR